MRSIFGLALVPAIWGAIASAQQVPVVSYMLENGMEVVVIEDHRAPIVTHMVWYRVGAADEPVGKSGIAHFLEHLMFKGTEAVPDGFAGLYRLLSASCGGPPALDDGNGSRPDARAYS